MNQSEIFTSIKAVGIEFEGLWYKCPNDLFKEDGSVEFDRGYEHDENCDDYDYCDCEQN